MLFGALACGSAAPPPRSQDVGSTRITPRPPLTADEAILQDRLRAHVVELSQRIGERNPGHPWELAAAADYVALEFEALGFPVERLGYEIDGAAVQNLAVTVPGSRQPQEVIVVGAYYDSAPGSRGENANATGVAALLELARLLRDAKTARTLRLVAFAVSAPPYAGGEDMGSLRYARELQRSGQNVIGMISLEGIGVLIEDPSGSSSAPSPEKAWVRLGSTEGAEGLRRTLEQEVDAEPLAVRVVPLDTSQRSDHDAFARVGIPAVWITGVGSRQPIDYDAMTRLVMRVRFGLSEILGEMPTNDGMLTPGLGLRR